MMLLSEMKGVISSEITQIEDILNNYKMGLITQNETIGQIVDCCMRCEQAKVKTSEDMQFKGNLEDREFLDNLMSSGIYDHLNI